MILGIHSPTIELFNKTNTEVITMELKAATQLSKVLKDTLQVSLKVFLIFSNDMNDRINRTTTRKTCLRMHLEDM